MIEEERNDFNEREREREGRGEREKRF